MASPPDRVAPTHCKKETHMPLYRTLVRPGLLDLEQREAFALDVVDVHCDVTGAPRPTA